MRTLCTILFSALAAAELMAASPRIDQSAVTIAQDQRSRLITISYMLQGAPAIVTLDIQTNITDTAEWVSIGSDNFTNAVGEVNKVVTTLNARSTITWNPVKIWPEQAVTNGLRAVVTAWNLVMPPDYMAVDLRSGEKHFYTSAEFVPGGVTNECYKTAKLLMRRIHAMGETFRMGSPAIESFRNAARETPHMVSFTKDYYMAVYEMTEGQWSGGYMNGTGVSTYPVASVSYNTIRGTEFIWPQMGHRVDTGSPIDMLRAQSGIQSMDLPTEAQWEFACRAGATRYINVDNNSVNAFDTGWFIENSGYRHTVGSRLPNRWGLYDMLGNVNEWCLDWIANYPEESNTAVVDPVGPVEGSARVKRGGCFGQEQKYCRCAYRDNDPPNLTFENGGFRVCCDADVNLFN